MARERINCTNCFEDFDRREDLPEFTVCPNCVASPKDIPDTSCPKCGWSSESITHDEDAPCEWINVVADWEYGWCGGQHWTERWTCPECDTVFELENGSV